MKKEIVIGDRTFLIREILAVELDEVDLRDSKATQKVLVTKGAGLSDDEYIKLTIKERLSLLTAINEINGFGDFQQTSSAKDDLITS